VANNFYQAPQVARVAVELAAEDAYLSALVNRNYQDDILGGGGRGRTVNVRIPGALIARDRGIDDKTSAIVLDELTESTIPVTLGTHAYSAVSLSEGDMSLNLESFSAQVLAPQVDAVVDFIEHDFVETLKTTQGVQAGETAIVYDETDPVKAFIAMRKVLRDRGVNPASLNTIVGTKVYSDLLASGRLIDVSQSASTGALREGQVGRVQGFTVVESTRIGESEIYAFSRDAFTIAVRPPVIPAGAPFGAIESSNGFGLRYLRDYDVMHTVDRSLVSTFVGSAALPLYRVKRDYDATTASVVTVPGGAALFVDTDTP
jgi:hypothetical protein